MQGKEAANGDSGKSGPHSLARGVLIPRERSKGAGMRVSGDMRVSADEGGTHALQLLLGHLNAKLHPFSDKRPHLLRLLLELVGALRIIAARRHRRLLRLDHDDVAVDGVARLREYVVAPPSLLGEQLAGDPGPTHDARVRAPGLRAPSASAQPVRGSRGDVLERAHDAGHGVVVQLQDLLGALGPVVRLLELRRDDDL